MNTLQLSARENDRQTMNNYIDNIIFTVRTTLLKYIINYLRQGETQLY